MRTLNFLRCGLLIGLLFIVIGAAAQTCRSESEIPSSTPTEAFADHGDGTVTHKTTGLMWMHCPLGQSGPDCATGTPSIYTWEGALEAAEASDFAGYGDWRLPDVNELRSIVEQRCYDPALYLAVFPVPPASNFWSSSPFALDSGFAWTVNFHFGYSNYYFRDGNSPLIRLVRSGK